MSAPVVVAAVSAELIDEFFADSDLAALLVSEV